MARSTDDSALGVAEFTVGTTVLVLNILGATSILFYQNNIFIETSTTQFSFFRNRPET